MTFDRRAFATAAAAFVLAASAQAHDTLKVDAAWARPTVEGQMGGGGFLRIRGGAQADRLLSANASIAQATEIHQMAMEGNVMRMRGVDGIDVPAGQTVELKPGGLHIMFMGLAQPLKAGDSFPLTLRFAKAGEVKVNVKVGAPPPGTSKP